MTLLPEGRTLPIPFSKEMGNENYRRPVMVRAAALMFLLAQGSEPWDKEWDTADPLDYRVSTIALPDNAWINVAISTLGDEYSIRKKDLGGKAGAVPTVWVRGFHSRNSSVPYRVTMSLYHFECERRVYWAMSLISYKADGSVLRSAEGPFGQQHIAPDTIAETWLERVCPQ